MKNYQSALAYLNSFINYEKVKKFSYKDELDLKRVENLFESVRVNPKELKTIHIAGTNGKGSTAFFASSILAFAGLKVGVFTSPHFWDVRERIKIVKRNSADGDDGRGVSESMISKDEFIVLIEEIKEGLTKSADRKSLGAFSFFELLTALASKFFLKEKVDLAVMECGLGGRLDATNLFWSKLSIITRLGYDHMVYLGDNIKDIAFEKAGIIKENTPVVNLNDGDEAMEVLAEKAKSFSAPFFVYNKDFSPQVIDFCLNRTRFDFISRWGDLKGITIHIPGSYQVENSCLAIASFYLLKDEFNLNPDSVYQGLRDSRLQGRFQCLKRGRADVVFDVAHNSSSFEVLNQNIKKYFPHKKVILIFGCSYDKNYKDMLEKIDYDKLVVTKADNPRAVPPEQIKKFADSEALVKQGPLEALEKAEEMGRDHNIVVIAGSVFLVSEIKGNI